MKRAGDDRRTRLVRTDAAPIFDPVDIVVWSIDTGIYDVMYSWWD